MTDTSQFLKPDEIYDIILLLQLLIHNIINNVIRQDQLTVTGNFAQGGDELLHTLIIAGTIAVAIFLVDTIFLTARRIRRKRIIRK